MEFNTMVFVAEAAPSGIAALGLNVQSFLFQLITFVIVLLILRKFVYGRLVDTLESRRQAVIESLDDAKEAAARLDATKNDTEKLLATARKEAADIVNVARKESASLIADAEEKAKKKAQHTIDAAEKRLSQDIEKARHELKAEMVQLVATATESIIGEKMNADKDASLIKAALQNAEKESA